MVEIKPSAVTKNALREDPKSFRFRKGDIVQVEWSDHSVCKCIIEDSQIRLSDQTTKEYKVRKLDDTPYEDPAWVEEDCIIFEDARN
jgi:hypothetical protein